MPLAKATLNGITLAESPTWETVEGNIYFPPSSLNKSLFAETEHSTFCPWKGSASYYSLLVNGETIPHAAWYYPEPYEKAEHIRGFVAFYPGKVEVKVE